MWSVIQIGLTALHGPLTGVQRRLTGVRGRLIGLRERLTGVRERLTGAREHPPSCPYGGARAGARQAGCPHRVESANTVRGAEPGCSGRAPRGQTCLFAGTPPASGTEPAVRSCAQGGLRAVRV